MSTLEHLETIDVPVVEAQCAEARLFAQITIVRKTIGVFEEVNERLRFRLLCSTRGYWRLRNNPGVIASTPCPFPSLSYNVVVQGNEVS